MTAIENGLNHEYAVNQKWAVRKMVQSHDSDKKLAYIHGFVSGIELLCARADCSNPAIAEGIRELAHGMADENREALRSMLSKRKEIVAGLAFYKE